MAETREDPDLRETCLVALQHLPIVDGSTPSCHLVAALSARSCRLHPDAAHGGKDVRLPCQANSNGSPTETCSWVEDSNKTTLSSERSAAGQFWHPVGPPSALATVSLSFVHSEITLRSDRAISALIPTVTLGKEAGFAHAEPSQIGDDDDRRCACLVPKTSPKEVRHAGKV